MNYNIHMADHQNEYWNKVYCNIGVSGVEVNIGGFLFFLTKSDHPIL